MNQAPDPKRMIPAPAPAPATATSEPRLRVSVIGGAHFSFDGQEIALRNRKARAIFGYLALTPTGEDSREKLAGLFWSEFSEQNARATLRQAIHEFREALQEAGCSAMFGTRTTVGLRPGSFSVDLDEILAAVAVREAPDVLLQQERLAETLLAGFDDLDPRAVQRSQLSFHLSRASSPARAAAYLS
jgi:DNA-binding SARP family transcriptional activator